MNRLLMMMLATVLSAAIAERDPFYKEPLVRTPETETLSVGVIGDGHCWHIWHTTSKAEWRESLPLFSTRQLSEKRLFMHKVKEGSLAMSAHIALPPRYPFECYSPSALDEVGD